MNPAGRALQLPPALPQRPCIRVVCPSAVLLPEQLDRVLIQLERLTAPPFSCRVRFDAARASVPWRDYYAGDDEARADAFVDACTEPDTDIVWWARGGGGAGRIAEDVIDRLEGAPPRIVIGFSDATALLNALTTRLGWQTFHGPVIHSLDRADLKTLFACLRGQQQVGHFAVSDGPSLSGVLRGGNLATLTSLIGRPFAPPGDGTLWLLEEVDEPARRIERCLTQMRDAGLFEGASGIWLGPLYADGEALERVRADSGLPVIIGAPAGHTGPISLLPIGARVTVDPTAGTIEPHGGWVERRDG